MRVEGFIAERLRFRQWMAVFATALSSFVIILAIAISGGFRHEIRKALSGMAGDIKLMGDPVTMTEELGTAIGSDPECTGVNPAIYRPGLIKLNGSIKGVMFKGTESADSSLTARMPSNLAEGQGLGTGDVLTCYFIGEKVQARKFRISGTYDNPLDTGENPVILVPCSDLQRLNGWQGNEYSELELVFGKDLGRKELKMKAMELGDWCGYECRSSMEIYSRIFDWLDIIDLNVLIIMILMVTVAGFNMISGLLIILFRNTSTIGLLKSMGMSNTAVSGVFLRVAARLAAIGLAAGNALAFIFCLVQGTTRFIRLNPANYFISFVPVKLDIPFILAADLICFVAIMALLLIPTLFISKVDPATTVRSE